MRNVALVLVLAAGSAHAQFKCTAPDGSVAFQQAPCPPAARSEPVRLPPPQPERPEYIRRAIAVGHVAIGMTRAELDRAAGGPPTRANRSVRANAVDDQLIYDRGRSSRMYVYLTDGVVTSFQDDQ